MAGIRKHGAHRGNLNILISAVGTAAVAEAFTYDAFAALGGGTASAPSSNYDITQEVLAELVLTPLVTITGAATNFTAWRVRHYNAAGAVVDDMRVTFDAAAKTITAFTPANLGVAAGAVVPGAGTATLTSTTGATIPWTLKPGDTIAFDTVVTGTGLAASTGGYALSFLTQAAGA
jgi:hypothetical protein